MGVTADLRARGAGCSDSRQAAESQAQPAPHSTDRASPLSEDPDRRGDVYAPTTSAVGAPEGQAATSHKGDVRVSHHRLRSTSRRAGSAGRQSFRIQEGHPQGPPATRPGTMEPHANWGFWARPTGRTPGASPRSGRVGATSPTQVPPRDLEPPGPSHLLKPRSVQSRPGLGLSMDSRAWIKSVRAGPPLCSP